MKRKTVFFTALCIYGLLGETQGITGSKDSRTEDIAQRKSLTGSSDKVIQVEPENHLGHLSSHVSEVPQSSSCWNSWGFFQKKEKITLSREDRDEQLSNISYASQEDLKWSNTCNLIKISIGMLTVGTLGGILLGRYLLPKCSLETCEGFEDLSHSIKAICHTLRQVCPNINTLESDIRFLCKDADAICPHISALPSFPGIENSENLPHAQALHQDYQDWTIENATLPICKEMFSGLHYKLEEARHLLEAKNSQLTLQKSITHVMIEAAYKMAKAFDSAMKIQFYALKTIEPRILEKWSQFSTLQNHCLSWLEGAQKKDFSTDKS